MSTFLIGDQGTTYTIGEGFSVGEIFAWEFTAEGEGWLEVLELLTNVVTPTATSLALGIYADAGATPGALLGEAVHAGKPAASSWVLATLSSRVQIIKGTKYWLATLPLGGNFGANLTTEHGSDKHQVGAGNTSFKSGTWEAANKTSLGFRGMGTAVAFMNYNVFLKEVITNQWAIEGGGTALEAIGKETVEPSVPSASKGLKSGASGTKIEAKLALGALATALELGAKVIALTIHVSALAVTGGKRFTFGVGALLNEPTVTTSQAWYTLIFTKSTAEEQTKVALEALILSINSTAASKTTAFEMYVSVQVEGGALSGKILPMLV